VAKTEEAVSSRLVSQLQAGACTPGHAEECLKRYVSCKMDTPAAGRGVRKFETRTGRRCRPSFTSTSSRLPPPPTHTHISPSHPVCSKTIQPSAWPSLTKKPTCGGQGGCVIYSLTHMEVKNAHRVLSCWASRPLPNCVL
jgi:hypothetical protein